MIVRGVAYWPKIVGEPQADKYSEGARKWSFDLSVDSKAQEALLKAGMQKRFLKNKNDDRGTFITFTRPEFRQDGTPSKRFEIIDAQGNPWDDTKLIGNGSELNVSVILNERKTPTGEKFLRPSCQKIQVWSHQEFVKNGGSNEFPIAPAPDGELNDELPKTEKDAW